jgi:hypothetical protein
LGEDHGGMRRNPLACACVLGLEKSGMGLGRRKALFQVRITVFRATWLFCGDYGVISCTSAATPQKDDSLSFY